LTPFKYLIEIACNVVDLQYTKIIKSNQLTVKGYQFQLIDYKK